MSIVLGTYLFGSKRYCGLFITNNFGNTWIKTRFTQGAILCVCGDRKWTFKTTTVTHMLEKKNEKIKSYFIFIIVLLKHLRSVIFPGLSIAHNKCEEKKGKKKLLQNSFPLYSSYFPSSPLSVNCTNSYCLKCGGPIKSFKNGGILNIFCISVPFICCLLGLIIVIQLC
jgi:hypothetical protein